MPELRQRNWKERRQVLWLVGLKPYRRWRVWAAMAVCSLVALWGLDMVVGNMLLNPALARSNKGIASALTVLAAICIPALLVCRHTYLKAMRPYLARAAFNPMGSWWRAGFNGLLMDLLFALIFIGCVVGMDWAINSYDERPDARVAAAQVWPEPIPDENNGFIAAIGLQAPPGTSPFEAGQRWVAGVNDALLKNSRNYPKTPDGLKYAAYAAPAPAAGAQAKAQADDPDRSGDYARFCNPGTGSCLNIVRREQKAVETWLAGNQELLTRYLALQKYLQWQYTLKQGDLRTPASPGVLTLVRAQSLMHAAALLAIEKGQTVQGLDMLRDDMRFVRNMLGSKDAMRGKIIATDMLARDHAVLAEIIAARPDDLKPYWAQVEKMLEPLTPDEVSTANALRFEQRQSLFLMNQFTLAQLGENAPLGNNPWTDQHYRKSASVNLMAHFWDQVIRRTEVLDASHTPPTHNDDATELLGISRVTGFMHNMGGKALALYVMADYSAYNYSAYVNRARDMNALNNLVRLRLALAKNNVSAKDVPAFLGSNDTTLWNPETGKPFEWDAEHKLVYFVPATDAYRNRFNLGSGVAGRVGFAVADRAMPVAAAGQAIPPR